MALFRVEFYLENTFSEILVHCVKDGEYVHVFAHYYRSVFYCDPFITNLIISYLGSQVAQENVDVAIS